MAYYKRFLLINFFILLLFFISIIPSYSSCESYDFETGTNANGASVNFTLYVPDNVLTLFHNSPYYNSNYKYLICRTTDESNVSRWVYYVFEKSTYSDVFFNYVSAGNYIELSNNNLTYYTSSVIEDDLPPSLVWSSSSSFSNVSPFRIDADNIIYMWSSNNSLKFLWGSTTISRVFPDDPNSMTDSINNLSYTIYLDSTFGIFELIIPIFVSLIMFLLGMYIIRFVIRGLKNA